MKHYFFRITRPSIVSITLGAVLLSLSFLSTASAQMTPFVDVPSGAYYEEAAAALLASGALSRESRLRPSDLALRAELVKLLVDVNNTPLLSQGRSSFNDVPPGTWYYAYFETAGSMNWIRGDGDCYGNFRPCTARPASRVNRAEAATLLVRVFGLQSFGTAPQFTDNPYYAWYADNIQIAADNCVLQGDDRSGTVRPDAFMNRAEMVVMFYRASQNMRFGRDCGALAPHISSVSIPSTSRIRVEFSEALRASVAETRSRYTIRRVSDGQSVSINSATLIGSSAVDLTFDTNLSSGVSYTVSVSGLVSSDGNTFSDSSTFVATGQSAVMLQATAPSARRIVLTFDANLNSAQAELASHYSVDRVAGTPGISVTYASLINPRSVELTLGSELVGNTAYRVTATALRTTDGRTFTDSDTVTFSPQLGSLTNVTVASANRILLTFGSPLDAARAENLATYTVSDGVRNLLLSTARLTNQTTVELTLAETLQSQRSYVLSVQNMRTLQGGVFSASSPFLYNVSGTINFTAQLTGGQETPSVSTSASGTGSFVLDAGGLHYDISVRGLSGSQITSAHFHNALIGIAGPVLQPISFNGTRAVGTWVVSTTDRNLLLDGKIYVNVHSIVYPNGEIRGQLHQ